MLLISLSLFAFNIYSLIYLQNSLLPIIKTDEDGQHLFVMTTKSQRFVHRIFDYFISIFFLYLVLERYQSYFFNNRGLRFREAWDYIFFLESRFLLHMIFTSFFYYFFSEVIFKTSIAKIILGNLVINSSGEPASIGQRIGRCFCRLIPFEAFSFLFSTRGWHDRITGTWVVKADNTGIHREK
ncbi:RDD family protein [Pedobacter frigiditerrae]|uniref:RDD family protein n=1 Tax=Pedobacter frigiditerrae TaxID=2530452 RepID=UPI0039775434